ncbi:MAG TPA: DUF5076 domain-containing protein [Brevundimonas sp.]|nr:DUF5076 domain-containing protein [Brevundimonas sp.]
MSEHKFSLPLPDRVVGSTEDGTVGEVARVWVNKGAPEIVVRPAFDDPRAMGSMLAEVCWNFAYAYEQRGGITQAEALEALRQGWTEGHARGDANARQGRTQ